MRTVLSVSLPEDMSEELERFAKRTGRNKSDIVKESLSLFLWEERFRQTQKKLERRAKKIGIVSEDDVFREVS
jgi:metal-responsive CopG/Arc/MetJ family transcriptional regulator